MATNGTPMSENGEHGLRISDSSDKTTSSGHEQVNAATIGDSQSSQESANSGYAKVSGPGQAQDSTRHTPHDNSLRPIPEEPVVHNATRTVIFRRGGSLRPVPNEHMVNQQRYEFEEDASMLVENPHDGRRKYSICGLFRVSRRQISTSIVIAAVLIIAAAATIFFVWLSNGRNKSEKAPFLNMRLKELLTFSLTVTKEESNIYEYVNITSPTGSSHILENDLIQSRRKRDASSMLWKSSTSDLSEGAVQMKIVGPNIDCMSEGEYIVAIHSGGRVIKTETFTVKITNTLRMFGSIDKVNEMEKSFSCTGFANCVNARINMYRNNYERSDLKDMVSDCSIHYTKEDGYRHVCTGKTNKSEIVCSLKSDTTEEIEGSANTQVLSECKYGTCQHGGTCTVPVDGTDYICTCQAGYSGHRCKTYVNECASSPCLNDAVCEDKVNEYVCQCEAGFTGVHCETDINDCADINCNGHGSCVDLVNDYRCDCEQGYTDNECQTEINECRPNPCMHDGTCDKNTGGYTCDCKQGFFGTKCQHDIDECASISCQNEGTCINTHGGYECMCVPGYSGNHCQTEIRECDSNPCLNGATCNDLVNKYECACVAGFTGVNCEAEIDECASHPCVNGATCEDSLSGFQCTCTAGFTGDVCELDIDECASISCQNEGTCINTHGGYECMCVPGYSGNHCQTEIRECTSNPCLNGATCYDLVNKYECLCIDGFTGLNCETEIDECASHPCVNGATCEDSLNGFQCTCTAGFTGDVCELAGPDMPCTGDDECVENAACLQDKCKCQEPYIASEDQPSCIYGCSTNCTNISGDSYSIYGNPCGYEFKRCIDGDTVVQPCKAEEVFSPLDDDCTCVRREDADWCKDDVSDTDLADVCDKTCSKLSYNG